MNRRKPCFVIIVDHQEASISHLSNLLRQIEYVQVVRTFTDPRLALNYLQTEAVDLVILDVDHPQLDTLAFLSSRSLRDVQVILYSARVSLANLGLVPPLLDVWYKPVSALRLRQSIERLLAGNKRVLLEPEPPRSLDQCDYFFQVKGQHKFMRTRILFKDITYIIKSHRNLLIYSVQGREPMLSRESFRYVWSLLPPKFFIRCANGTLFNTHYFHSYEDQCIRLNQVNEPIYTGKLSVYSDLREFLEQNKI